MLTGPRRLTTLPIEHHDLWKFYKKAVASFWTAEEIDLARDPEGYAKLNPKQKHFLKHVLAFFAASDGLVNANLMERFLQEVTAPEASSFYGFQIAMESIHSEVYSRLIEALCPGELDELLSAVETFPAIKKKADWVEKWTLGGQSLTHRLVAFACVEGIFFSGSFAAIFWLKSRGYPLPGLYLSNQFIARDEGMHTDFACLLVRKLLAEPETDQLVTEVEMQAIVREAVTLETEFLTEALPVGDLGMNAGLMATYIRFVADRLLGELGAAKVWNVENPFAFMEAISMEGKTNFFEQRVSEYQKAGVLSDGGHSFVLDADF